MLPDSRYRQSDYLLETTRALTEDLDLGSVLTRISTMAAELLAGRAALIALRHDDQWRVGSSYGIRPEFLKLVQRLLTDVPPQPRFVRRELTEVNSRLQRITESASMGLFSSVGLPLVSQDEVVGVIFVFRSYEGAFSSRDREVLQAFASQAAVAVQNARLYTEVAQQKQYLDAVVDSSADGIFILDQAQRFRRFNPACTHLTGFAQEAVIGLDHGDVIKFKEIERGHTLEDAIGEGWPGHRDQVYVEGDLKRADGRSISVAITYAPVLSERDHLVSTVANMRDITHFREADELKSTFISIVSHELRTPVALIKGYVGTLRRHDAQWDAEVVKEGLEVIEDEADHLAELIDDLLDATRLQAGTLQMTPGEISLKVLAEKLTVRFETQTKAHKFALDFSSGFPLVRADESRMMQVLNNLISNAIKFSPQGGTITLYGRYDEASVTVCVQDEGPGVPAEDRQRIFDRFYRGRAHADETPGTGLGLFLARAIIEAHGGEIWVASKEEPGARICFSLPRAVSSKR